MPTAPLHKISFVNSEEQASDYLRIATRESVQGLGQGFGHRFLVTCSRFEYALKRSGFACRVRKGDDSVKAELPMHLIVDPLGRTDLASVCSVIFALLVQGSLPTLKVTAPALLCTAAFAAPAEPISRVFASIVFDQKTAPPTAGFGLQCSGESSLACHPTRVEAKPTSNSR